MCYQDDLVCVTLYRGTIDSLAFVSLKGDMNLFCPQRHYILLAFIDHKLIAHLFPTVIGKY